ncbi:MAG: hypothetical protein HRT67_10280 [Flavobacteriaceae bacterium]|nr:hypothetical protein [Flavobacteriaceae bacterium]
MYNLIKNLHSYWAFLVLGVIVVTVVGAFIGLASKKVYTAKAFRLALFGLIVSHLQLMIGMILYFVSPRFALWGELGAGVMSNSLARLYLVEHPIVNILAIVCITKGYSKHKKKRNSKVKYKIIALFYLIGLVLLASRIPYRMWLNW